MVVNNNNVLHSFPVPRDSTNTIAVMGTLDNVPKFGRFGLAWVALSERDCHKVFTSKDDLKKLSVRKLLTRSDVECFQC